MDADDALDRESRAWQSDTDAYRDELMSAVRASPCYAASQIVHESRALFIYFGSPLSSGDR